MKIKKFIMRFLIVLFVFVGLVAVFLIRASSPVRKEQAQVTEVAKKYADLKSVNNFYWYNEDKTYYTVTGKNNQNQNILVTIPKDEQKVIIQNQANGITEKEALNKVHADFQPYKVLKVEFGYYKDKPVWEVTTQNKDKTLNYYTLSFKDGNVERKIEKF